MKEGKGRVTVCEERLIEFIKSEEHKEKKAENIEHSIIWNNINLIHNYICIRFMYNWSSRRKRERGYNYVQNNPPKKLKMMT